MQQHMDYGTVIVRHTVRQFVDDLSKDGFKKLIYSFLSIRWSLRTKSATMDDYVLSLNNFRQQHYHAFLYHHKQPSKKCLQFMELLQTFHETGKKTKQKYKDLFTQLESFSECIQAWPGGHFKGTPFVFTNQTASAWFFDEVLAAKKKYGVGGRKDLFYPVHFDNKWTGHVDCPANRIGFRAMTTEIASYLIHVGYESVASVQRKWNLQCEHTPQRDYAIVHKDAPQVVSVFEELTANHHETLEQCLCLHIQSPEQLRARVFKTIVRRYDDSVRQLIAERGEFERKYKNVQAKHVDTAMRLRATKRKLDDTYNDCAHMEESLTQAKREIHSLCSSLRQRDADLRQSIGAQWDLYHRLYPPGNQSRF